MSLFKARDYWVAQCGAGEEFDSNCLCVANVDNDPNGEGVFSICHLTVFTER